MSQDETNALGKHMLLDHPEEPPNFSFKVDKVWKTSLGRQIREAILIAQENPEMLLNSKSEWGMSNRIPRVVVFSDDDDHQDHHPHDGGGGDDPSTIGVECRCLRAYA